MIRVIVLLLVVWFGVAVPQAAASTCRDYNHHRVCIVEIKRSAKNYWEYRASVSVDGSVRPIEVYNCRQRVKVQKNGGLVPFDRDEAGALICRFFKRE